MNCLENGPPPIEKGYGLVSIKSVSVSVSVSLSLSAPFCLSVCLSVCLCLCLSVCMILSFSLSPPLPSSKGYIIKSETRVSHLIVT